MDRDPIDSAPVAAPDGTVNPVAAMIATSMVASALTIAALALRGFTVRVAGAGQGGAQ